MVTYSNARQKQGDMARNETKTKAKTGTRQKQGDMARNETKTKAIG